MRIISGMWKGRKLRFPPRSPLRPTLGRARETLFNWLVADVADARCLDLFAGSGCLGFEALSRGAASTTFVDQDAATVRALKASALDLNAAAARIHHARALTFLKHYACDQNSPFDLVFLDPPFDSPALISKSLDLLTSRSLLSERALIYVEYNRHGAPDLTTGSWSVIKSATAGESQFGLLATGR
ncbi:MAG: 16S rRNA (guanine(966)-N(2))-methyltransferase RsmD [Proteobacteria bacterium]|nr:16S rRNA (guanine(966)-N(2))-methyltransferase RsmD [Pseudomonadota bacterium]